MFLAVCRGICSPCAEHRKLEKMHKQAFKFKWKMIPFGANVNFKPSDARKAESPWKFGPRSIQDVFAGYEVTTGMINYLLTGAGFLPLNWCRISAINSTHRIHLWYIYLHLQ